MKIGVLTGGGDCPGLNAVLRAVVKNLILHSDSEIIGFRDGFRGMIEHNYQPLDYRAVSGILTVGGTILGTNNKANPMRYYARNNEDVSGEVVDYYYELGLDGIIALGGDGTMAIANGLSERGLKFIGIPKTIDNDLPSTDRTFGFDTAVGIATDALVRLQTTGQSHGRVMILETMGRYAGWIALESGIAGGADIILIPEIPYDLDTIVEVCKQREKRQRFTVIVVAEGAKPIDGEMVIKKTIADSPDPIRLGGVANVLRAQLEERLESEVRSTVLGHVQRGGTPSHFDRVLATRYGAHAADLAMAGDWGNMVTLSGNTLSKTPISQIANRVRNVPTDGDLVHTAMAVGTSFGTKEFTPVQTSSHSLQPAHE